MRKWEIYKHGDNVVICLGDDGYGTDLGILDKDGNVVDTSWFAYVSEEMLEKTDFEGEMKIQLSPEAKAKLFGVEV